MKNLSLFKESIKSNLVFVSGLVRSGKSLLLPIIASFENTEKSSINLFLEQIPCLNSINQISDESTIYLLKEGINKMVYENAIGRNANFRNNDFTSVWNYREPMKYIERLSSEDGDNVIKELEDTYSLFPLMIHNGLSHGNIWFAAFPSAKMIHMQRNPIDIVYSWSGKKYGGDFFSQKRSSTATFEYKGSFLPYFAYGSEEKYLNSSGIDRIIYSVDMMRRQHKSSYEALDRKTQERILFVSHEQLLINTDTCIANISRFLKTKPSIDTASVLLEQNCPRDELKETPFLTSGLSQKNKLKKIKSAASENSYGVLMNMCNDFNSNNRTI